MMLHLFSLKSLAAVWVFATCLSLPVLQRPSNPVQEPVEQPTSARIDGLVLVEGKPVAGVKVRLLTWTTSEKVSCTSDAKGAFRMALNGPVVGFGALVATANDGALQGIAQIKGNNLHSRVTLNIDLKPSFSVTIRVVDGQMKPVAGAAVCIPDRYFMLTAGETDEQGMATCRIPADAQVWWIMGLKPGAGFDYFENYKSWPPSKASLPPAQITLMLEGSRKVTVHTNDAGNMPLSGFGILPIGIQKKGKISFANLSGVGLLKGVMVRSDQQGIAHFDWIPRDLGKNGITFQSGENSYESSDYARFDPAQESRTLVAHFVPATTISGKVSTPDGKPKAGILLYAARHGRGVHARTSSDGTYRLEVQGNETYRLAVFDDDWAAPPRWVVVNRKRPPRNIDLQLIPGTLVQGTATFGPERKPVVGDLLLWDSQAGESGRWIKTEKNGAYKVRLPPGEFRIGLASNLEDFDTIVVGSEETLQKDLHLKNPPRASGIAP
jgi:hypothetical protein